MADFSTEEINKLLKDVHSGKTHLFNLPVNIYKRVAEGLTNRVYEAFNLDVDTNLLSPDFETPRQLKRNAYIFSAAKTFQEVQDMQNFLFNDKGFKRQFNEFEKEARQIFDTYNKNWLEAEYETALRQSESAADWERIQAEKDIFPLLRYKTLSDGSVRQEHQTLHNIVRPVDDPFWDRFTPPNGWRCRCFTEQLEEDEAQVTPITQSGGKTYKKNRRWQQEVEQPNKLFDFNPAKEGVIFREDAQGKGLSHPYFKVSERWNVHKRNNFGLPLPNDIKDLQPLRTIGKQKVKTPTVNPTVLKTTPVESTKIIGEEFKPKNFNEVVGKNIEMPVGFWRLLKKDLKGFRKSVGNEGSYNQFGKVVLDLDRYNTKELTKKIIAHEIGHEIHIQREWVTATKTHPIFEKFFNKWRNDWGGKLRGRKRALFLQERNQVLNFKLKEKLKAKYKHNFVENTEHWASLQDTIGALTDGQIGYGHTKGYYKADGGLGSKAEFFAHAMENTFSGNPYFKEIYPEMYEDTIEMIKELTKTIE